MRAAPLRGGFFHAFGRASARDVRCGFRSLLLPGRLDLRLHPRMFAQPSPARKGRENLPSGKLGTLRVSLSPLARRGRLRGRRSRRLGKAEPGG